MSEAQSREDHLVERILFALLGDESIDLDETLAGEAPDVAAAVQRRVEVAMRVRGLARASAEEQLPLQLGEFVLEEEIGRGGMGVVYRALQPSLRRHVAVKVLNRSGAAADTRRSQRFLREVDALTRLAHPAIVPVLSAGETEGTLYFAMPLVVGVSFADLLARYTQVPASVRTLQPVRAAMREVGAEAEQIDRAPGSYVEYMVRVVATAAAAIAHAHQRGVLHRDIKPGNIMVTPEGGARLIDFGLVHVIADEDVDRLTRTREVVGTLAYLAPEQLSDSGRAAAEPDVRAEVYSLGVVLYEALSGTGPLRPGPASAGGVLDWIRGETTPVALAERRPDLPRDLLAICDQALQRDPDQRYASMQEFAEDLERVLRFEPVHAERPRLSTRVWRSVRRRPRAALAILGLLVLVFVAVGAVAVQSVREARRHADACREFIAFAAAAASRHEQAVDRVSGLSLALDRSEAALQRQFLDQGERRELVQRRIDIAQARAELRTLRREIEVAEERVLEIAPDERAELGRAVRDHAFALIRASWSAAVAQRDDAVRERCLERARKLDRTGVRARLLVARGSLLIRGGADEELYLFRHVPAFTLRAGETSERWIPAPCAADGSVLTDPSLPIGRCCLLVTRDHPGLGLHSGDLIVEIEGRPLSDAYYFGRVDPDGLAGRAGVRAWDRVDRIDGIEAVSWSEIRRAVCFGDASLAVESTSFDGQHVRFNLGNREPRKTVFEQAAGVEFARLPELLESFVPGRPVRLGVRQAGSGSRLDRALPADGFAGLKTTLTIYPLCPIPACRLRSRELELVVGEYTVLSRPPGSTRWVRDYVSVGIDRETTLDLASLPDPPPLTGGDVVWVPSGTLDRPIDARAPGARPNPAVQVPGFWIDRHELTLAEWNAFTTDPTIAAETEKHYAETGFYTLVPRSKESTSRRTTSQPMSLLSAARWVDYEDVLRYVRWVNERLEREDSAWRADLPTMDQWERAAGSTRDRVFPWGDTFEPGLVHFQFTWPDNIRMPTGSVLGDESPFGVRDLAGCVAEWLREPREDLRSGSFIWVAGGCYSYTWGDAFRTQSLTAESRSGVNDITGIRLVYEPRR